MAEPLSFSASASPVPGHSELPSRTAELLEVSRGTFEMSEAAAAGVEANIASLRRGLEDTRAIAREVQRTQRQETRTWRSELETAMEGLKVKLSMLVSRESLDTQVQDLRSTTERRHSEISKEVTRRAEALEISIEAVKTSVGAETSSLHAEFSKRRNSSVEDAESSSFQVTSPLRSRGPADIRWESRLGALEQHTSKLSVQLAGLSATPTHGDAETVAAIESAARHAETAERRAGVLESAYDGLHERYGKIVQDVHNLQDAADSEHERTAQLQQIVDEIRERSNMGLNTSASNVAALDATIDAQRQRIDDESRARQRAIRELEQQLSAAIASTERLCSETRGAATAAGADAAADAETRVDGARRKNSELLQQMTLRLQKVEELAAITESTSGSNVAAVLDRLARLEVVFNEDMSKFDRLERRLEERASEVRTSTEAMVEQRGAEALATTAAKLEAQRTEAERRLEQMQRELRGLDAAVDTIKDSQRRASQANGGDVGRLDEIRKEARRVMEGLTSKLREDLDAKHKESSQTLKDLRLDLERQAERLEPRLSSIEPCLKDLELHVREFQQSGIRELEPKMRREFDVFAKQLESRQKDMETRVQDMLPRFHNLEPRMNSLEPFVKEWEPRLKTLEPIVLKLGELQNLAPRVSDLELRVRDMEPRLRDIEPRLKDLEPRLTRFLDAETRLRDLEPRLRDFEPKLIRLQDTESKVREMEPRLKELHQWVGGFEPWLMRIEPQVNSLELSVKSMEQIEPRVRESLLRDIDSRLKDIEQRGRDIERNSGGSCVNLQRSLEAQVAECQASVRTESSAWRDALRNESVSWREACSELRSRTDGMREEMQQGRADAAAERVRLGQLSESLNEVRHQLKQQGEDATAKLSQSMNEVGWRLSRRIDEADACAGEARAAVDEHQRQLVALERGFDTLRTQTDKDKEDALKEIAHSTEMHRQAIVSQATDAVKAQLADTTKATERCEESSRQTTRALAELADVERDLGKKFERWGNQVAESAQQRLQERLQEMLRSALSDVSAHVSSCAERHAEKAVKASQKAAQAEAKEDGRQLREEFAKVTADAEAKLEQSIKELRVRVETLVSELSSVTSETSRLDAQQCHFQKQEASIREALDQGLAGLRKGADQQKAQFSEVYDRIIPSLREVQASLIEEKQSRGEEGQRLEKRFQEFEARSSEQTATQRRTEAAGRGFAETLRACEGTVAGVDSRLESLEEMMEDRLHQLVHNEVMGSVMSNLEDHQRGHLQLLEGKMDKIVRNMHTPSGRAAVNYSSAPCDNIDDKERWRQRFRSSLGDSLYIKKALHNGGRSPSTECPFHNGKRSASTGCLQNEQRSRRR